VLIYCEALCAPDVMKSELEAHSATSTSVLEQPIQLYSAYRTASSGATHLFTSFKDALRQWLPSLLVFSYHALFTLFYLSCSNAQFSFIWSFLTLSNYVVATLNFSEIICSILPIVIKATTWTSDVRQQRSVSSMKDDELLNINVVIVAYLPNEKEIVIDRLKHALETIDYPKQKLQVNLVYNTPYSLEPLETELREFASKHSNLRVIRVAKSTSKAENLNYFLSLNIDCDLIALFDCDHYIHPLGPRLAALQFITQPNVDVLQGRCVVMNTSDSPLASMVAIEFDYIYAACLPGRAALWNLGLFSGSNAYWRSSSLRRLKLDPTLLSEDIDCALRAHAEGATTVHDIGVISYELAPTNLSAFWQQRLRWAQGWTQVSFKHLSMCFSASSACKARWRKGIGLFSLLLLREMQYYLFSQYTIVTLAFVIRNHSLPLMELLGLAHLRHPLTFWLSITR
jgi:cellulose synthase/poly-beta-1,6-N-acetylglucosamine synthase-like glycosyltransferase